MKKYALLLTFFFFTCAAFAQDTGLIYQEAQRHLINLINLDTSQPDPDETKAARYLYKELNKHGIDWDFYTPHKGAANLLARIKGTDPQAKPLLLISHLDTAPAGENWNFPPYKATIKDGKIYGLGATDAKNYTAMHLALLTYIKDSGITPKRDIIFLATSAEESGSATGLKWLAETHWDQIAPGYALNEGGGIIKQAPGNKTIVFAEAATKMYMDVRLTASGEALHSSLPVQQNAVYVLSQALAKLPQFNPSARLTNTTREFFRQILPTQEEDAQTTIQLLLFGNEQEQQMAAEIIAKDSFFRSQLKDTVTPVSVSSGTDTGASSPEVSAIINVRLLPGTDPEVFFEELKTFLGSENGLSLEITERPQAPLPQPMDGTDDLFAAISAVTERTWTDAVAVPGLSPASGDSEILRRLGVITYGLGPAMNTESDNASAHTADEYISQADYQEQVEFFTQVVYEFAFDKAPAASAEPEIQSPTDTEQE